MRRTRLLPTIMLAACCVGFISQSAESGEGDPPADAVERMLVLKPGGPVLIEITIAAAGPSFEETLDRRVREMMPLADTDNDGKATWREALRNSRFTAYGEFTFWTNDSETHRKRLVRWYDRDRDGHITPGELRRMLRQTWPEYQVYLNERFEQFQPDVRKLLDVDGDGSLSREELAGTGRRLKSRDTDDNDLLDFDELGRPAAGRTVAARLPTDHLFNLLTGHSGSAWLNMKTQYADSDGKIRIRAFTEFPEMFRALDENRNGILDFKEAAKLNQIEPQLRLRLNMERGKSNSTEITLSATNSPKFPRKVSIQKMQGHFVVSTRGCRFRIDLPSHSADGGVRTEYARRQVYLVAEVMRTPLFSMLDTTGDNRLSLREMRTAGRRLLSLDTNKNGAIDAEEMTTQITFRFTLGRQPVPRKQARPVAKSTPATSRTIAPKWFTHMDKNGDGDVSLREFLGNAEQFRKLDTNNDGFIERVEANAARR